jgi:hypothetical protein
MASNPLDNQNRERERRIRMRARRLWEADGRPSGHDAEYLERARELIGMEENPQAGQLPHPMRAVRWRAIAPIEEAELQENLGEFPGFQADQGERQQTPSARRRTSKPGGPKPGDR